MSFEKDLDKSINDIANKLIIGINQGLSFLKEKIEAWTPEDTRKLVWSYETEKATRNGDIVSWKIKNKTPYAYWVEYWVWGKIYKYNKPKWNIFKIWVGARMMTKAKENNQSEIISIISKNLWA